MSDPVVPGPVVSVAGLDIRLVDGPLPFAEQRAAAIAERWRRTVAAKPALYDGPILLFSGIAVDGDRLVALGHRARFSALMVLVEDGGAESPGANLFGAAAIVSSDGAVILGCMGAHTAFPGVVKFVGGTPDEADLRPDGTIDIAGSIARETAEETGLVAAEAAVDPRFLVVADGPFLAIVQVLRMPETAAALIARIDAFNAAEAEPELAGAVAVRPGDRLDGVDMPGYTRAIVADLLTRL